jgi:hypothetical protein
LTCAIYALFFGLGFASFTDPDYWWHLRTGRLIIDELSIPRSDVFSFTAESERWIVHEWLSEVLIYMSVSAVGYAATLAVFVFLILGSFALLQRTLLKAGTPPVATALLVGLAILISLPYWTVRPQVLTWTLVALTVNALWQRERPAWFLIPVFALWSNVHLGFLFGLGVVGLWFVSRFWEHREGERAFAWKPGLAFVGLSIGATCLNPSGPLLIAHALPFAPLVGGVADIEAVSEWSSPNFHEPMHLPLLAGVVALIALSSAARVRDRFAALLALAFTVLALYSSRYQPLFAIAFLPAAGIALRDLRLLASFGAGPGRTLNWALVGLVVIAAIVSIPSLPNAQVSREARTNGRVFFPADELRLIQERRPDANVFAMYEWGGYFANGLYPEGRVFIDGRADMYGAGVLADYNSIIAADDGWQELLETSGADTVVVPPTTPLAQELDGASGWTTMYAGRGAVIYAKN